MYELISPEIFSNKKKVFFVGAMGSGKTEIAINYSRYWSRHLDEKVGLVDFDMVKPYFRLRNAKTDNLEVEGVEVVAPRGKLDYLDSPAITPYMDSYIKDHFRPAVIDVGGDDVGAMLVGRYHSSLPPDEVEFWYVFNGMRPFSRGADDVLEIMDAIEKASRYKITGIIHNSHLMGETIASMVIDKIVDVERISKMRDLPVRFHCVREDLYNSVAKDLRGVYLLPLKLFLVNDWV